MKRVVGLLFTPALAPMPVSAAEDNMRDFAVVVSLSTEAADGAIAIAARSPSTLRFTLSGES